MRRPPSRPEPSNIDQEVVQRSSPLSINLPPRCLRREVAAAYVGVSPALFNEMVRDGRMPQPKLINARTVWDRFKIDVAFDDLPERFGSRSSSDGRAIDFAV